MCSYCLLLCSVSSLSILNESAQDEGQAIQHATLKKLYTVLSKGLHSRIANLTIKLQCNREVS